MRKIIVFGNTIVSKVLWEDIARFGSKEFLIEAFTTEKQYLDSDTFCDRPLVDFEGIEKRYPPDEYDVILAVGLISNLRERLELHKKIKAKGYYCPNYISPLADVSPSVKMGENNIIHPFVKISTDAVMGSGNIVWGNSLVGMRCVIGDGTVLSAGCVVAGNCIIGDSCYVGAGAVIRDHTKIADEVLVGAGAVVVKNTEAYTAYVGNPAKPLSTHKDTGITIRMDYRDEN